MEQAWKYQPWVQEAIDKRLNRLYDVKAPTIGFHVRGGDKLAEDKMLVRSLLICVDQCSPFQY
jgi:hypothetical protein